MCTYFLIEIENNFIREDIVSRRRGGKGKKELENIFFWSHNGERTSIELKTDRYDMKKLAKLAEEAEKKRDRVIPSSKNRIMSCKNDIRMIALFGTHLFILVLYFALSSISLIYLLFWWYAFALSSTIFFFTPK